ncbi:nucleotidyl transferase AbiEii/AbiGii toxin family protein [Nocardioides terrisoli]|uniref:nucleotidyl transferase AbiEii/AbiGii toxin family protein n=1 Tax=Nocardioides terrisoli TaxID=3388267 RepID=UPI00287B8E9F|nr:nucleotidyl transferase AbiEii/AbiGii toxin family protein [Nocardioides marmorisolisilvae]
MTARYDSSPSNLRALRDRLTAAAKREGVVFGRLQQHVGVLVVAQFMNLAADDRGAPILLVKGGASLELRRGIPESRTSKDLDAVLRGDIETAYERLVDVGADGWEGFTATFTTPVPFEVPGLVGTPHRLTAKLAYRGKPFVSVPIEISPTEAGNAEAHDMVESDALALVGLPSAVAVPCMTTPWQIAQKIHASSEPVEPPRTNDRARDLVDLQLLEALTVDDPLAETESACRAVFEARGKHGWPPTLAAQPGWEAIYVRALEGLEQIGLAADVGQAVGRVQNFIDSIAASR